MIDKEILRANISKSKQLIVRAVKDQDKNILIPIRRLNKELVLVVAKFKCQRCGAKEKLQIHHMILRKAKKYMDFWRYISQRHYWANQIILCEKCHCEFHDNNLPTNAYDRGVIRKDYIKQIMEKYKK